MTHNHYIPYHEFLIRILMGDNNVPLKMWRVYPDGDEMPVMTGSMIWEYAVKEIEK